MMFDPPIDQPAGEPVRDTAPPPPPAPANIELARLTYEHRFGPCELSAVTNPQGPVFGVKCVTYDQACPFAHDPVTVWAVGATLFEACFDLALSRYSSSAKLKLRLEDLAAQPASLRREFILGFSGFSERARTLFIPAAEVERLYQAATAALTGSMKSNLHPQEMKGSV